MKSFTWIPTNSILGPGCDGHPVVQSNGGPNYGQQPSEKALQINTPKLPAIADLDIDSNFQNGFFEFHRETPFIEIGSKSGNGNRSNKPKTGSHNRPCFNPWEIEE